MKCSNCDCEISGNFTFCPNCGAKINDRQDEYPIADRFPERSQNTGSKIVANIPAFLKDNLFLVICILSTVGTITSMLQGNLPILSILMTVFLWLTYATVLKNDATFANHMRSISGTIFAQYVIHWVMCGLIALSALVVFALIGFIGTNPNLINELFSLIENLFTDFAYANELNSIISSLIAWGIAHVLTIAAITLLLVAVGYAMLNIFGIRSIHKFAQSLYLCETEQTNQLVKTESAMNWLLVFGILKGISALTVISVHSMLAFLAKGSIAAAYILAYILLKRYFVNNKAN